MSATKLDCCAISVKMALRIFPRHCALIRVKIHALNAAQHLISSFKIPVSKTQQVQINLIPQHQQRIELAMCCH